MEFQVGKYYKTRGGWKALIVWISKGYPSVVHFPDEPNETPPLNHAPGGEYLSFTRGSQSTHDLVSEWEKGSGK